MLKPFLMILAAILFTAQSLCAQSTPMEEEPIPQKYTEQELLDYYGYILAQRWAKTNRSFTSKTSIKNRNDLTISEHAYLVDENGDSHWYSQEMATPSFYMIRNPTGMYYISSEQICKTTDDISHEFSYPPDQTSATIYSRKIGTDYFIQKPSSADNVNGQQRVSAESNPKVYNELEEYFQKTQKKSAKLYKEATQCAEKGIMPPYPTEISQEYIDSKYTFQTTMETVDDVECYKVITYFEKLPPPSQNPNHGNDSTKKSKIINYYRKDNGFCIIEIFDVVSNEIKTSYSDIKFNPPLSRFQIPENLPMNFIENSHDAKQKILNIPEKSTASSEIPIEFKTKSRHAKQITTYVSSRSWFFNNIYLIFGAISLLALFSAILIKYRRK